MHEVVEVFVALYFASQRDVFPDWGYEEVEKIQNGDLLEKIKKLFSIKC